METLSTVRKIRNRPQPSARCGRSKNTTAKICPFGATANAFLKQQFLPLIETETKLTQNESTEKGFFDSLSILTALYGFTTISLKEKPYPYNILLAHKHAQKELSRLGQDIELVILADDTAVKLATNHTYSTGTTLYYIPILPLYKLLQDKKQKRNAELLLSVFAYLYHIAGIPYYRDDYSVLAYYYEVMEDWMMEAWEEEGEAEEKNCNCSALNKASFYGDVIYRKMYNPYHLSQFEQRIDSYREQCAFDYECLTVAQKAFALMSDYPHHNIFRNTRNEDLDQDDGIIRAEQYISFIAENEGTLYEEIARMVNDEFNECSQMEQPSLRQVYDRQDNPCPQGLDFEYRIFPLLNDLCTLLNQIP